MGTHRHFRGNLVARSNAARTARNLYSAPEESRIEKRWEDEGDGI
jgi:hypothetical protein